MRELASLERTCVTVCTSLGGALVDCQFMCRKAWAIAKDAEYAAYKLAQAAIWSGYAAKLFGCRSDLTQALRKCEGCIVIDDVVVW
jgi:hypothetical protein